MYFFQILAFGIDDEHVGQIRSPIAIGSGQEGALCIMCTGDKVVSCSFLVFYCDNKES